MKIGALARATGASVRALRYYESEGLLDPRRDASGHRTYTDDHTRRVLEIQEFFTAGLCSRRIRELLELTSRPHGAAARLHELIDVERARLTADLRSARARLEQFEILARPLQDTADSGSSRQSRPEPIYQSSQ